MEVNELEKVGVTEVHKELTVTEEHKELTVTEVHKELTNGITRGNAVL
jgi:hypothetical protein